MAHTAGMPVENSVRLWFGTIGAPFVWAAHFLGVWALTEVGCRLGLGESRILGIYTIQALALLSTIIALALIATSGVIAYRTWRLLRSQHDTRAEQAISRAVARTQFMSMLGIFFSILFAAVVVYMLVPVFVLPLCDIGTR